MITIFENFNNEINYIKMYKIFCDFLSKNILDGYEINKNFRGRGYDYLCVSYNKKTQWMKHESSDPIFILNFKPTKDEKSRKKISKFKIHLDISYQYNRRIHTNIDILLNFIKDTILKYSYNKKLTYKNDFFINDSYIEDIKNDLDEFDFELFINAKNFNL